MTERKTVVLTLLLLLKPAERQVLLGMKKRGFGMGRWNGFGGKVEKGETIVEGARREMREEAGVDPTDPVRRGHLTFTFNPEIDNRIMEVHLYTATKYTGEVVETEEMRPKWFKYDEIPYDDMWTDDRYWVPQILNGKRWLRGKFQFEDFSKVNDFSIEFADQEPSAV